MCFAQAKLSDTLTQLQWRVKDSVDEAGRLRSEVEGLRAEARQASGKADESARILAEAKVGTLVRCGAQPYSVVSVLHAQQPGQAWQHQPQVLSSFPCISSLWSVRGFKFFFGFFSGAQAPVSPAGPYPCSRNPCVKKKLVGCGKCVQVVRHILRRSPYHVCQFRGMLPQLETSLVCVQVRVLDAEHLQRQLARVVEERDTQGTALRQAKGEAAQGGSAVLIWARFSRPFLQSPDLG